MKGFWTVIDAGGSPLAIVKARHPTDAKYRLACLDLWTSGCEVRECTPDENAYVAYRILGDDPGTRRIWWIDSDMLRQVAALDREQPVQSCSNGSIIGGCSRPVSFSFGIGMAAPFQRTWWLIAVRPPWKAEDCEECVEITQPEGRKGSPIRMSYSGAVSGSEGLVFTSFVGPAAVRANR